MPDKVNGFTLIEVVIAMMLTSMALTISFSALRLGMASLEKNEVAVERLQQLRVVNTLMQNYMVQARTLQESKTAGDIVFEGSQQRVVFVAPAPTQRERIAGLYLYSLRLETSESGGQLLLDYQPYWPGTAHQWSSERETVLLIDGLKSVRISYYGKTEHGNGWLKQWTESSTLPRMLAIDVAYNAEHTKPVRMVIYVPGS